MKTSILIIVELDKNGSCQHTLELVRAAEQIQEMVEPEHRSGSLDSEIKILVPGQSPLSAARQIAEQTGYDTVALHFPVRITPESLTHGLCKVLKDTTFSWILMSHTTLGREVGPRLGVRFRACTISGVTGVEFQDAGTVFSRAVMDNEKQARVCPGNAEKVFLTMVPGVFSTNSSRQTKKSGGNPSKKTAKLAETFLGPEDVSTQIVRRSMSCRSMDNPGLAKARVVVSAGRGIGEKENLETVFKFADIFPGASVGASRPLVDQGWIGYGHQVGITGATVAPDLYIACGISGSSQHLAGMSGSKWVVSINKNPNAAMSRHADLSIQADTIEFIEAFLDMKAN